MNNMVRLIVMALLIAGCDAGPAPELPPEESGEMPEVKDFFPVAPGNRWVYALQETANLGKSGETQGCLYYGWREEGEITWEIADLLRTEGEGAQVYRLVFITGGEHTDFYARVMIPDTTACDAERARPLADTAAVEMRVFPDSIILPIPWPLDTVYMRNRRVNAPDTISSPHTIPSWTAVRGVGIDSLSILRSIGNQGLQRRTLLLREADLH